MTDQRLTIEEAEELIDRFIEKCPYKSTVTSKEVIGKFEVGPDARNRQRVYRVLDRRYPEAPVGKSPQRFRITEEGNEDNPRA